MNRIASLILILGLGLILIVNCGPKKTKEQLYAEASEFEKDENFKEAIVVYEQLIKDYPRIDIADSLLFIVGQIYSNNLLEFENAVDAHKRLVKKYPDSRFSAQSLFMIGYHYANSISDTVEARRYYEKFLAQYPEHELATSVQWELNFLGKDINEIEFLKSGSFEEVEQDSGVIATEKQN